MDYGNYLYKHEARKYKRLTMNEKVAIIQEASKGLTHKRIAEMFGVGRSTVTKLLLSQNKSFKVLNDSSNEKMDRLQFELYKWLITKFKVEDNNEDNTNYFDVSLNTVKNRKHPSVEEILKKAQEIAIEIGLISFLPSYEWIYLFLKKHDYLIKDFTTITSFDKVNIYDQITLINQNAPIENFSSHIVKSNVPNNFQLGYNSNLNYINNNAIFNSDSMLQPSIDGLFLQDSYLPSVPKHSLDDLVLNCNVPYNYHNFDYSMAFFNDMHTESSNTYNNSN